MILATIPCSLVALVQLRKIILSTITSLPTREDEEDVGGKVDSVADDDDGYHIFSMASDGLGSV